MVKEQEAIVISIDHGVSSAFSIFKEGDLMYSSFVKFSSVTALDEAFSFFLELFKMYKPNVVVLEKVNVMGSSFGGDNVVKLAQLQGVIKLCSMIVKARVVEANPSSMKKFITGNGKAKKEEVAKNVAYKMGLDYDELTDLRVKKTGREDRKFDKADSIALGMYYLRINGLL